MADGSVEIKITGSVDPSLAASASEAKAQVTGIGDAATVSSAKMAAALQAAGGDLKKVTPAMLGLAAAAKGAAVGQEALAAATATETVATEASTAATINSRAAYESLVLVHEALSGRFTRMAGSSMILTQQLAGQGAVASAVGFATSGLGAAVLGTVAVLGAATVATIQYEQMQKQLLATAIGLGAASGLTAQQLEAAGQAGAHWSSQSISQTTKAAEAFAAAGIKSQTQIEALSGSIETYAQLTGVKFAKAQETLAAAMQDPVKGAKELHQQLKILDGDQIEQIERLTESGDKDKAVAILVKAYTDRINEAQAAGVGFASGFGAITNGLSNFWGWLGRVNERLNEYNILMSSGGSAGFAAAQQQRTIANAIEVRTQAQARLNETSGKGAAAYDATPEGRAAQALAQLKGGLHDAQAALQADLRLHGAHSDAVERDRRAIEDYTHAVSTYLTPVQRKLQADQLDVRIAAARHEHNQQLVRDLTEQKALLQQAGVVESAADAKALAAGAGDVAGARVHQPKEKAKKGPDIVTEWEEQLHAAEVASKDFFSDQTEAELKFWQAKVGQTTAGSKDWLAVQSKIYEAQKTLAHRDYDEHIAALNDQLQADRDNWAKEKADWDAKLQYIADHFTKESKEYRDAHREFEAAEREHQQQILQAQRDGEQKQIQALRSHLQAEQQIRQENARVAEEIIRSQADASVFGEINAATKVGQLHRQLAEQEIADAETAYRAEDALRQQTIADALKNYTADSRQYKEALAAKALADKQYYDQKRVMETRAAAQEVTDILAVKQAYHGYVDGLVSSTTSAFSGILSRTQTWQQAMGGVFNSLLSTIDQVLSKMLSRWIVVHVLMSSRQRAELAAQQAQHLAAEATKTASTTAGASARTAAEEAAAATAATTGAVERVAEVTGAAAVAAANAFAATAAIPIIGPALAPEAAAAAEAAVMAFVPQASLAVGTNELPRDMIVQAHEGERIIPKADNRRLMDMLQVGVQAAAANNNAPAAANDRGAGGIHVHYHDHSGTMTPDQIMANRSALAKAVVRAHREGAFSKTPLA